jgi:hypothetical protein
MDKVLRSAFWVFLGVATAVFFGYSYYLCHTYKEGWLSIDGELPKECYTTEKVEEFEGEERRFYKVKAQYCPDEPNRVRLECRDGEVIIYGVHGVWKPEGKNLIYVF